MSLSHVLLILLAPVLLWGCALKNDPTPLGDSEIVGQWLHDETENLNEGVLHTRMALDITRDGYASYVFISCVETDGGWQKSRGLQLKHMPIIAVSTKKIKVQTFPLTPKWEFQITAWPHQEDGRWHMSIDRKAMKKVEDIGDATQWQCDGA